MDYETYETDRVYDSMERNPGVDEVSGVSGFRFQVNQNNYS